MRNCIFLALFACVCLSPATAAVGDGGTLLKLCRAEERIETTKNTDELADALQCQAYIEGVFTGYSMVSNGLGLKEKGVENVCVPDEVKLGQMILVVQKYLKDHPEKLHQGAAKLTMTALKEAFPCK